MPSYEGDLVLIPIGLRILGVLYIKVVKPCYSILYGGFRTVRFHVDIYEISYQPKPEILTVSQFC